MVNLRIKEKYHLWFRLTLAFFLIQNLVRTLLAVQKLPGFLDLILIYSHGFIWDLIFWSFLSLPFLFYSNIVHSKFHPNPFLFRFECGLFFLCVFFMTFIGSGELFFWNEFKSRFNFIAVDYLIYTNEVLNNIKESYPMDLILLSVLAISLLIGLSIYFIKLLNWTKKSFLNKKNTFALLGIFTPLFLFTGVAPLVDKYDNDFREDQLSRNGYIELVRAYFSNQISYKNFYANLPDQKVNSILERKKVLISPSDEFKHLQKPNVVMIVVESLGAKFIAPLGGFTETTPFLNQLSKESIFFENLYATGTRTVRGLEAINLSVPPTPGYAVLKRPNHKNLFSLGNTFKKNGYDTTFLYGGNGFFDNMNSFFENNYFNVVDVNDFNKEEITFKNAWGVCDEDLFSKAQKILNQRNTKNPFLLFMLTTSNHRPFTYPDGKIDIPSGTSRAGAVKYTDFAIGQFLKNAQNEKWFKDTLFVIVADHSTEGRGRFELEMRDFHIPLWIYSPQLIKPRIISRLSSQIDLLPSLIHMLNLNDDSPFFGHSLFNPNWTEERAFIGNYQYVGYYKNNVLITLGPNRTIHGFAFDPKSKKQTKLLTEVNADEAITYYQSASNKLDNGAFNLPSQK